MILINIGEPVIICSENLDFCFDSLQTSPVRIYYRHQLGFGVQLFFVADKKYVL